MFSFLSNSVQKHVQSLIDAIPFAVSASLEYHDVNGKKVRGRLYPWGLVETENPDHSDYIKLRSMLVSHMQDLREVTNDVHYENFRSLRLSHTPGLGTKFSGMDLRSEVSNISLTPSSGEEDKDRILMEKEAELRRMQEMIAHMQEEMLKSKGAETNGH